MRRFAHSSWIHQAARLAACVACLCAVGANARPGEIHQFVRKLSPGETEAYRKALASLADVVSSTLTSRGFQCQRDISIAPPLARPQYGFVTADGVIPELPWAYLKCELHGDGGMRSEIVSIQAALDPRARSELLSGGDVLLRRGAATLRRIQWPTGDPHIALVVEPPEDAKPLVGALSVDFLSGDEARELALALDDAKLRSLLRQIVPLPPAAPPSIPDAPKPAATLVERRALEREVIESLVASELGGDRQNLVVEGGPLSPMTFPSEAQKTLLQGSPDLRPSLLADFVKVLRAKGLPALPAKATVLSGSELKKLFGTNSPDDGFAALQRRYPGTPGIVTLSRVAFSNDMSQAMVYLGWQAQALMGQGTVYILGRSATGWTVLYESMLWIS